MSMIKTIKVKIILFSLIILTGCSGPMTKLGLNNGNLTKCPSTPNCVNSQIINDKHFIQPIVFMGKPEAVKVRLLKILAEFKQSKTIVIEDNYIQAQFVSTFFRFVDDIEFYFPEIEGNETTIQIRSASRVGRSDFGVNRKRVERFRDLLK